MKSTNIKTGNWTKKKNNWYLRIKETNLLIGTAYPDYSNSKRMEVYAFFHDPYNTNNESIAITTTDDPTIINNAWMKCMDKLLDKMFI